MAGGRFIPGVEKDRPGTYTNFEDADLSLASMGGGGSGGGGGGGPIKPGDYTIGKIVAVSCQCSISNTETDFVAAADDVYCGTIVFD